MSRNKRDRHGWQAVTAPHHQLIFDLEIELDEDPEGCSPSCANDLR
jgi:hypothetical protein